MIIDFAESNCSQNQSGWVQGNSKYLQDQVTTIIEEKQD